MATACLFISFNRPFPGREAEAYGKFERDVVGQMDQFRKEGWFESYEVIGLTPHAGELNGFILLSGDRAKLDELRRTDAFERFSMLWTRLLDRFGVVPGVTLEGLRKVRERQADLFQT